jgi:hypothetical protein
MKSFRIIAVMVAVIGIVSVSMAAPSVRVLTEQEKAALNATHEVIVKYSDFTETTVNTAQTFTNILPVAATQSVEVVAMMLKTAFDVGTTNYTGSCLLEIGDGSDTDGFLSSTELASDGTEVFLKFGRVRSDLNVLSAATVTTTTYSNMIYNAGATTANVSVVTAVAPTTNTMSNIGMKLYTAADYVDFKFTPNADEALTQNTAGEVRVYLRILDASKQSGVAGG